jgi:ATP-dependent 26S proteasome regulatory subunit
MTSELLNLIDGAGPERDRVKFIFTFNMKVSKVDPALLRKGRLLKSIEFKELTGDTLVKVASEFGVTLSDHEKRTGLTVADLVYHDENTGIKSRESIGFK